jgi:hypothetical protein
MCKPDKLAAMKILSIITIAAWIAIANLMPLLVSKQVSLSFEYGNAFASPFAYANFGLVVCGNVGDIETGYELGQLAFRTNPKTTSNSPGIAFDLAAVIKASQAIASEIELEQLLNSLMKIFIKNAGAQTGFLILENAKQWVIEACGELNDGDGENVYATQVLQSLPTANRLPESIINYVIRTQEWIILNDADHQGDLIDEPYIQHTKIQSILGFPLLNQSKLVGVLYLENQLAAGAFTP